MDGRPTDGKGGPADTGRSPTVPGGVALVTGGASGIGLAAARRLLERGYQVAVADVNADALDRAAAELGAAATTYVVDVRDRAAVAALVKAVEDGLGPIEHVLGCAGIARVGATLDVDPAAVELMMNTNFFGVVNLVYSALPLMVARGRGEFAVISSITAVVPPRRMAGYGASKAAVLSLMESLRDECAGSGVRFACVCPAAVATPMATDFFPDPAKRARSMAIPPQRVVAALEKGLRHRNTFRIYPDPMARALAVTSRYAPRLPRLIQRSKFGDLT